MANFTDIFIRRPVLSIVVSLLILLSGIASYFSLNIRQYPRVQDSIINVHINYAGATPEVMESYVTTPIENAIGSVDGIDYVSSSSNAGSSDITVFFNLGYDINTAIADITNAVSSARWQLPDEVDDPVISKQDPNAYPTMFYGFIQ